MSLSNPARPTFRVGLATGLVGVVLGWTLHVLVTPKPTVDVELQRTLDLIHQQNQQLLRRVGANSQAVARPPGSIPASTP